jgi:uncharacterized protein (TIGR01777 family)
MKVLVTGSSGLIGKALQRRLEAHGDEVRTLVRRPATNGHDVQWDPEQLSVEALELEGHDAVVHLAGESIAEGRWSPEKMQRIRESRVRGTRFLCETLAALERKPRVLVCASAIGFYGDRSDDPLDEQSESGEGFLADVCREWEDACEPARRAGIRVVNLRIGVVLSRAGGALAKMLLPFKLGLAGRIGSGRQWMSWIELEDVVSSICHALETDSLYGPVNAVSPHPVTNDEYTKTLGRVLSRPTVFPMPAVGARLAFGKMADELLLASMRVEPKALQQSGFRFAYPTLDGALRHALGRGAA